MRKKMRCARGVAGALLVLPVLLWGFNLAIKAQDADPPAKKAGQEGENTKEAALRLGIQNLKDKEFAAAEREFRRAIDLDPKDGNLYYFLGVVKNRRGQYRQALNALNRAAELKASNSGLQFELGWSYVKMGRWNQAIEALEAYAKEHPDRAQTYDFLGRAYMEKGEYTKAEDLLNKAMTLDTRLESTCRLYLMELERRKGNYVAAAGYLQQILQEAPESFASDVIRSTLGIARPTEIEVVRKTQVKLILSAGYDSNAAMAPDLDAALFESTGSKKGKHSEFFFLGLDVGRDLIRTREVNASAGLAVNATWNEHDFNDYDIIDNYAYIYYYRQLLEDIRIGIRGSDQYTFIGNDRFDDSFRNRLAMRPALVWRPADRVAVEFAYELAKFEFFLSLPEEADRDGHSHAASVVSYYNSLNSGVRLRLGAHYLWNYTQGEDYDYEALSFFAGAHIPLVLKVDADAYYRHIEENYSNPNSLSDSGRRRRDDIDVFSLQLSRPVHRNVSLFVRGDLILDESNIDVYEYDQERYSGGVMLRM